ncbi:acylphosphatase [Melioribacteraceae bacterium 4301-Me]|uniref:acylphosphatase n=1 Tax=Pyranulibacter aquaticus TaxID=3163344 RepID=UPI003597C88C
MEKELRRAEIVVNGLVQGVGFRYFALRTAEKLGLKGYVKNLYTGEVYALVEGERQLIEEFYNKMKIGPMHADVRKHSIKLSEPTNEFTKFEIRY